jgi:hypothetical protein
MLQKTKYWKTLHALHKLSYEGVMDKVIDDSILFRIAEYNREQLREGKRSDGSDLPDYSDTSVFVYGKEAGPIKLFDTGFFYESIEAVVVGDVIAILSNPIKRDEITGKITNLKERYEPEIIGISEENLNKVRVQVKTKIVQYIQALLRSS